MSEVPTAAKHAGFVASDRSWAGELPTAAAHCARTGAPLVISSQHASKLAGELTRTYPTLDAMIDIRSWASTVASEDALVGVQTLFDLDMWAGIELTTSGARRILSPSTFIPLGKFDLLAAQLELTGRINDPRVVTLVATDAAMLGAKYRSDFITRLQASPAQRFAFVFAHSQSPMGSYDRLDGLRRLLTALPGSMIVGTDVPAGTDALVHGAGWVGFGASSGRRMERRPGDKGGGRRSADDLPGTWVRELMEMRSPTIYADWYANERTPLCPHCGRPLESYQPSAIDKALLIAHNLHGIDAFVDEILAVDENERAAWLNAQRLDAFERHAHLTGKSVDADLTLRRLCELDDQQYRQTSKSGRWTS